MKPRYRILKIIYDNKKEEYYVQKSVRLFGRHLWWTVVLFEVDSHEKAIGLMEYACGDNFFEYREEWHKENMV